MADIQADGQTGQTDRQGRQGREADKADRQKGQTDRQTERQGRQADKADRQTGQTESESVYYWQLFSWIVHTVTIKYTKPRMYDSVVKHRKLR